MDTLNNCIPALVTRAGSLFCSFCLIFSNFSRLRKITLVFSSPCCNLKWNYRPDFAFHVIFTSETSIENVVNVPLYVFIDRTSKHHFAAKVKTRIESENLMMASLTYACFIPTRDSSETFQLSPANSSNIAFKVPLASKWRWQSGRSYITQNSCPIVFNNDCALFCYRARRKRL